VLARSARIVADALTRARECRLTSAAGTDVVLGLEGREAIADDGDLRRPGAFGNLPAGEAYIAPVASLGDGTIVIDGSLTGYGALPAPLQIELQAGRLASAEGDAAAWLLETLDAGGPDGRVIAELGIGVNPNARLTGTNSIVDEKASGTAHVAFGDNTGFGGTNHAGVHIDATMLAPRIELDGAQLGLPEAWARPDTETSPRRATTGI
jgi:leucyl aminopeptidase (aminopeptidase T)